MKYDLNIQALTEYHYGLVHALKKKYYFLCAGILKDNYPNTSIKAHTVLADGEEPDEELRKESFIKELERAGLFQFLIKKEKCYEI